MEHRTSKTLIGKWGKNLAVRFPAEIAQAINLKNGEEVEFEKNGPDLLMRRIDARADAEAAAKRIARRRGHSLDGLSIRDLIDEGRKY